MPRSRTFTGRPFEYNGNINNSLIVYPLDDDGNRTGTRIKIDSEVINLVKDRIRECNRIKMGACRDNPAPNSLGEMLQQHGKSPQLLSYILPLLEEDGFLAHERVSNAIWINYAGSKKE